MPTIKHRPRQHHGLRHQRFRHFHHLHHCFMQFAHIFFADEHQENLKSINNRAECVLLGGNSWALLGLVLFHLLAQSATQLPRWPGPSITVQLSCEKSWAAFLSANLVTTKSEEKMEGSYKILILDCFFPSLLLSKIPLVW